MCSSAGQRSRTRRRRHINTSGEHAYCQVKAEGKDGGFGTKTLYAVWEKESTPTYRWLFELKFDANGGTGAPATMTDGNNDTYRNTNSFKIPQQEPTREGYVFLGWSEKKDATTAMYKHDGARYYCRVDAKGEYGEGGFGTKDAVRRVGGSAAGSRGPGRGRGGRAGHPRRRDRALHQRAGGARRSDVRPVGGQLHHRRGGGRQRERLQGAFADRAAGVCGGLRQGGRGAAYCAGRRAGRDHAGVERGGGRLGGGGLRAHRLCGRV